MFGRRPRRRPPRPPARPTPAIPAEEVFIGGDPSPFTLDEQARIKRNEAAAALIDDDTMGYVVVRLRKDKGAPSGKLEVSGHVRPEWTAHFRATLERIVRHGFA